MSPRPRARRRRRPMLQLWAVAAAATMLAGGCAGAGTDTGRPAPVVAPSPLPPVAEVTPQGLADAIDIDRVTAHLRALQQIADDNDGTRAAGTPGNDASIHYVAGLLREAGFEVSTPEFSYTRFTVGSVLFAAGAGDVKGRMLESSVGTRGPLTARPVSVPARGCEAADFPADVRGAFAVIARGECTFSDKARNAQSAGAVGVVIVDDADEGLPNLRLEPENVPDIPVIVVTRADAGRVGGARELTLDAETATEQITTRNVIAETRTGAPDDVVMAGAHLDSVSAGPGIDDNGTGAAALLETALRLGSSPDVPQRVRFGFWGAEEEYLRGSWDYVGNLRAEDVRAIALYLNFDMLGSPNGGYFTLDGDDSARAGGGAGPAGSDAVERVFRRFFAERGIPVADTDLDGRSDYAPFLAAGVPVGGLFSGADGEKSEEQARMWGGKAGVRFDPNYHRDSDTIDNVDFDILAVNSAAAAYALATYALSTTGPDGVPPVAARERTEVEIPE
ncbi:M28 family peptidase [Gordonia paraffinivorans]|nr:M28 family peptidase [Gordonia paraffinivorans]